MGTVTKIDVGPEYAHCIGLLGPECLPPCDDIRVTLEPNMTRSFGRAMPKRFRRPNGQLVVRDYYAITISKVLLRGLVNLYGQEAADKEYRATMIHELAHIMVMHVYPEAREHHGPKWITFMVKLGEPPDVYYNHGEDSVKYDWGKVAEAAREIRLANLSIGGY